MIGRREFRVAAVMVLALATIANPILGADSADREKLFDECAEACFKCQRICDVCAQHCMTQMGEGKSHHMASLRACLDCADICSTASRIVARKGVFSTQICAACADSCTKCAAECDKHGTDAIMTQCAKQCRACETACREMLK